MANWIMAWAYGLMKNLPVGKCEMGYFSYRDREGIKLMTHHTEQLKWLQTCHTFIHLCMLIYTDLQLLLKSFLLVPSPRPQHSRWMLPCWRHSVRLAKVARAISVWLRPCDLLSPSCCDGELLCNQHNDKALQRPTYSYNFHSHTGSLFSA